MFVVFIGTRPDVCWLLVLVGSASTGSELSFGHFNRSSLPIVRSCTHELTKCFKSDLETCLGDSVITFEMDNCHAFWNYMAAKHCQSSPASPTRHSINDLGQWEIHWVNYTYTSMLYHWVNYTYNQYVISLGKLYLHQYVISLGKLYLHQYVISLGKLYLHQYVISVGKLYLHQYVISLYISA